MSHLKFPVTDKDHAEGNANAQVVLVEYGDYQCPHCGRAYPIVKAIQKQMGDKLKFVFRNFPLAEMHPNAEHAALAAEAAALQDKFWPMHDQLFEHQQALDDESLVRYAKKIGISQEQFTKDFENDSTSERVENDIETGIRSGVNGTPSFFVNGVKYEDNWESDAFLQYLQQQAG